MNTYKAQSSVVEKLFNFTPLNLFQIALVPLSFALYFMSLLFGLNPAVAQQVSDNEETRALEEIIVTARFRAESINDVGASISALSGQTLSREGLVDFSDIAARTPGLNLNSRGPNKNDVNIRGIANGVLQQFADSGISGPLISQFVDDIPVSQSTASQRGFNYFDFDRVEVLRGPQPTLFGEGSVGGTIRYFSANPDLSGDSGSDSSFKASLSSTENGGTNYSISGASTFVLIPDELAVRGVLNYREDDGYIDNVTLGQERINDYDAWSGRLTALYEPSENLSVRLMAFVGEDEIGESNAVSPIGDPSDLVSISPFNGGNTDEFELYSAKIDYDFGSFSISSITGYYDRQTDNSFFCGGCGAFGLFLPQPIAPASVVQNDDVSFTQEFRIVSQWDGPLSLIGGVYYQDTELTSTNDTSAPGFDNFVLFSTGTDLLFQQHNLIETEQISAFVELTYDINDSLRLIGGVRYVDETVDNTTTLSTLALGGGPLGLEPPFFLGDITQIVELSGLSNLGVFELDEFLPRVSLEYDISDDSLVYATVAKGLRNGNLNPSSSAFFASGGQPGLFTDLRTFTQDELYSAELGWKSTWLDGALSANVAAFFTNYEDPQLETSSPFVFVVNGPDLEVTGVEWEVNWLANDNWSFFFSGAYQNTEFQDNQLLSTAANAFGFAFDLQEGNESANSPDLSFSVGANALYPINSNGLMATAHIGYSYIGERFSTTTNFPSSELGSLGMLSLRLGIESEKWTVTAFVSNAFDDIEFTAIEGSFSFLTVTPGGELDFFPVDVAVNRPRTFGIEATYKF